MYLGKCQDTSAYCCHNSEQGLPLHVETDELIFHSMKDFVGCALISILRMN